VPCPRKDHVEPLHPLVSGVNIRPGRGEGMADMKGPVHVRIGKSDQFLFLGDFSLWFEDPALSPLGEPLIFDSFVQISRSFG
jgi:hypothetical protein